jgi:hypothetical protein
MIDSSLNAATAKRVKVGEPMPHKLYFKVYLELASRNDFHVVPTHTSARHRSAGMKNSR